IDRPEGFGRVRPVLAIRTAIVVGVGEREREFGVAAEHGQEEVVEVRPGVGRVQGQDDGGEHCSRAEEPTIERTEGASVELVHERRDPLHADVYRASERALRAAETRLYVGTQRVLETDRLKLDDIIEARRG